MQCTAKIPVVNLDALKALLAKATQGEWRHHVEEYVKGQNDRVISAPGQVILRDEDIDSGRNHWKRDADVVANWEAIAALHNAAPGLIAEVEAAREVVKAAKEALTECHGAIKALRKAGQFHENESWADCMVGTYVEDDTALSAIAAYEEKHGKA